MGSSGRPASQWPQHKHPIHVRPELNVRILSAGRRGADGRPDGRFQPRRPGRRRDLKVTTDFRDVYATLLEKVLGADAGAVLPGYRSRAAFL
jgi:hypothetical protein